MNDWGLDELSSITTNQSTCLVYFYTPLCGTCQLASRMLQIMEQMVEVNIGKMNLNYFPEIAMKFSIESVPCLLFFKDGEVVETVYAFHSIPYLYDKVKSLL